MPFFSFWDGKSAYRGCTSDIDTDAGKQYCASHPKQCYQCAKRGCNDNRPKMIDTVACFKCNSGNDMNCLTLTAPTNASLCAPFESSYTNYCFIRVINESVTRGCLLEHADVINDCNSWDSTSCEECLGDECNKRAIIPEFCIQCDSKIDSNCTTNPVDSMKQQCSLTLKPAGCYRKIVDGK